MSKRKRRDIYKKRTDPGFCANRDVDLEHLRTIMATEDLSPMEYNYYGLYVQNIVRISLNCDNFRGYDEYVKDDMRMEALIDCVKARKYFKSDKYPAATAPFNYLMTIAKHSFQHVLEKFYRMQNKMVAASNIEKGASSLDGSPVDSDLIDRAVTDWDLIAENLV